MKDRQDFADFVAVLIIAATMFAAIMIAGCKGDPPPPPAPVTQPAADAPPKPLIVIVSGKGQPQLREVANMIRREFSDRANVADFQTGPEAWRSEVGKYLAANPHSYVVAIGHSWGTSCLFSDVQNLGDVRLLVTLDPCRYVEHPAFRVTPNVRQCVNVTADFEGLIRASIDGPHLHYRVHGGHSSMTRTPETLAIVRMFVGEAIR